MRRSRTGPHAPRAESLDARSDAGGMRAAGVEGARGECDLKDTLYARLRFWGKYAGGRHA